MKKFLTIVLILIIALSIVSCGKKKDEDPTLNLTEPVSSSNGVEPKYTDDEPYEFETYENETIPQNTESNTESVTEPTTTEGKNDVITFTDPTNMNSKSNLPENNTTQKQTPTEAQKQNPTTTKPKSTEAPKQSPTEAAKPKATEAPKQNPTEKPPTSQTTENKLNVTFSSNIFDSVKKTYTTNKNGTITVAYYIDFNETNDIRIDSIQFDIKYDAKYLSFDPKKNCSNPNESRYDLTPMFPISQNGGIVNVLDNETIRFLDTYAMGRKLENSKGLIPIAKVTFDVKKGVSGSTKVTLDCNTIDFINCKTGKRYVMQDPVVGRMDEIYKYIKSISKFSIEIK